MFYYWVTCREIANHKLSNEKGYELKVNGRSEKNHNNER